MPLHHGKSKEAFGENVEIEMHAGKPQAQALAIAYKEKRKAQAKDGEPEIEIEEDDEPEIEVGKGALAQHRREHKALKAEDVNIDCSDGPTVVKDQAPARIRLALDRAPTMRTRDAQGFLHVRDCNISKANVCPYLGKEIPNSESLGLDNDHVYRLYRDAAALEAAAPTFERVPLMMHHIGVTADNPQKQMIIGTVSNVRWKAPYLVADLTVWDAKGIEAIESERQQELSPGYRYTPQMNSGVLDGEAYDGRMLDILANHVAIVDTGRTGPDVFVKDSAPKV